MTSKQSARDALATAALRRMFADEADAFDEFVANHKHLGLDYLTDCVDNMCRTARQQADDVLAVLDGAEYEVVAAEIVAANGAEGAPLVDQAAEAAHRGVENSVTLHDHYSATISLRIAEIQPQYGLVQLNASRKASDELVSCDVKRDAFIAAVEQVLSVKVIDAPMLSGEDLRAASEKVDEWLAEDPEQALRAHIADLLTDVDHFDGCKANEDCDCDFCICTCLIGRIRWAINAEQVTS